MIDVPGDDVHEGVHSILIMKSEFLLVRLNLPQDLFLLDIVVFIHKVQGLVSGLCDDFCDFGAFLMDGLNEAILGHKIGTTLDFCSSRVAMRVRRVSCILE